MFNSKWEESPRLNYCYWCLHGQYSETTVTGSRMKPQNGVRSAFLLSLQLSLGTSSPGYPNRMPGSGPVLLNHLLMWKFIWGCIALVICRTDVRGSPDSCHDASSSLTRGPEALHSPKCQSFLMFQKSDVPYLLCYFRTADWGRLLEVQ